MVISIRANIGSGNGLVPDGTKSSPEPMLTYPDRCFVALTWEQFNKNLTMKFIQVMYWETLLLKWLHHLSPKRQSVKEASVSKIKSVMLLGIYCLTKPSFPWPLILDLIHHLVWHISCRGTNKQLRTSVTGNDILVSCFPANACPSCMTGPNIIIIVSAVAPFTNMV